MDCLNVMRIFGRQCQCCQTRCNDHDNVTASWFTAFDPWSPLSWWRFRVWGFMSWSLFIVIMTSQFCMIVLGMRFQYSEGLLRDTNWNESLLNETRKNLLIFSKWRMETLCQANSSCLVSPWLSVRSIKGVVSTFFTFWPWSLSHDVRNVLSDR